MPLDGLECRPTNPAVEKLDEVIRLLASPEGWCERQLETNDGRHCIARALHEARGIALLHDPILAPIRQDAPATTHADICMVLQRTRHNLIVGAPPPSRSSRALGWLKARIVAALPG